METYAFLSWCVPWPRGRNRAPHFCAAHFLLYLGGTIWLCATTGNTFMAGLSLAVFPYIPLDMVKIVFCSAAVIPLRGRLMGAGFLTLMPEKI